MDIISVVIPVFNSEKYISRCLESLCKQTYKNIEIICVDDGSMDNSENVIKKYVDQDNRIAYMYQENKGVYEARRNGINVAKGNYIAFVDSDDWVEEDYISNLYQDICECEMSTCSVVKELQNAGEVIISEDYFEEVYDKINNNELWNNFIFDNESNKVQRLNGFMVNKLFITEKIKEVVNDIGESNIRYSEDSLVTYLYVTRCKRIKIGKKPLYHYCYNENSACNSIRLNRLSDVEKIYGVFSRVLVGCLDKNKYLLQVEKWVSTIAVYIINSNVDFVGSNYIMQYIYNFPFDKEMRLVIYGAGKAGNDLYKYLMHYNYNVVLWVDKNYERMNDERIQAVKELESTVYDYVILASGTKELADNMREFLREYHVEEKKIFWTEPMRVY